MQKKDKHNETVLIDMDMCTGCMNCRLICSFVFEKVFNPDLARIRIGGFAGKREIEFLEECTQCNMCVEHCVYGTLTCVEEIGV